jgi:serine/threonine protein kinase
MELLNGESLRSRLARSARLDLEVVAKVGAELLGALGAAHRARAVHPNLSVDEVFIAERRGGDLTKLRGFRPVEESRDDPRADLHQAGRVIYEALTGEAPPTSDDDRLPPGPSELRDDLGLDADAFASRALAPTADERFQSADEMLDAWSSIEALSSHLI